MCIRPNKIIKSNNQNQRDNNGEVGAALTLFVLISAVLLGFVAWSTLTLTKTSSDMAYQANNMNQARTAALVGVSALQQTISAATSSNASSNLVGTQASADLTHSQPYLGAYVSASIINATQNTISTYYTINSQGKSGRASAELIALIKASASAKPSSGSSNLPVNLTGSTEFSGSINLEGDSSGSLINNGSITSSGSFFRI